MKKYFAFILQFISIVSFGQFAVVADKDGTVNVRAEGNSKSQIIDKLPNGQLIYCFDIKANWANIHYSKQGRELDGFVYIDRYKLVSDFSVIPIVTKGNSDVKLKKDSIEIKLTQSKFEKSKHKLKYFKQNPTYIELIDNKQYWGTDGEMPTTQFDQIILKIGQTNITLPKKATVGLYEPRLSNAEAHFDRKTNTIYIQTSNSDAAGYYEVIWKIQNGIYQDRLVAYGFRNSSRGRRNSAYLYLSSWFAILNGCESEERF
jgi:hypothetical protein